MDTYACMSIKKESSIESILSSRFATVTVYEALQTVVMTSLMLLLDFDHGNTPSVAFSYDALGNIAMI